MKRTAFLALLLASLSLLRPVLAAPLVLYVSEGVDKRIAVFQMDPSTGELTRQGAADLPSAPGSLAISPDHKHLYASVRSSKQFATLSVDAKTGALGAPTYADA